MTVQDWDYPSPFVYPVAIQQEHIDGLGHVNNAVYVNWCQDAGWAHSLALGLNLDDYRELDAAMVIRRADYDYIGAAFLGQRCEMATWLTGSDQRLTMERRFQLRRVDDGQILLRARWQLVCIRLSSGKARRMPEVFNAQYGAAIIDP
ncbi:acyl-CoA thioesterase [Spongiibacter tropicus]|uniref:acyl-CoA thioesterase n=1 Tax=Spongiibacter tropicus TaxID=454602 RepID=UPI0024E1A2E2|nr:thioesterase family protein [Spongiibacter tropicus]